MLTVPKYEFPDKMDALSRAGAASLVDCIQRFWVRKGYAIHCERFQVGETASWGVRSNLVGGLPAKWRGARS
jgi:hypothetical protein